MKFNGYYLTHLKSSDIFRWWPVEIPRRGLPPLPLLLHWLQGRTHSHSQVWCLIVFQQLFGFMFKCFPTFFFSREVRTRPGYTANELNELYCLRCHDKMGIPICGACRLFLCFFVSTNLNPSKIKRFILWLKIFRRPIEERVVTALGKHWHVEHFVCAKVAKKLWQYHRLPIYELWDELVCLKRLNFYHGGKKNFVWTRCMKERS